MAQIGNVPEINSVKENLDKLKNEGLIKNWELPYEHLLTRLTAAVFFLSPTEDKYLEQIWKELEVYSMLVYKPNESKRLSELEWQVEFNKGFEL